MCEWEEKSITNHQHDPRVGEEPAETVPKAACLLTAFSARLKKMLHADMFPSTLRKHLQTQTSLLKETWLTLKSAGAEPEAGAPRGLCENASEANRSKGCLLQPKVSSNSAKSNCAGVHEIKLGFILELVVQTQIWFKEHCPSSPSSCLGLKLLYPGCLISPFLCSQR